MFSPWGFGVPGAYFSPWGFGTSGIGPSAFYSPFGFGGSAGRPIPPPYSAGAYLGPCGMGAGFSIV
ncbi:MAG: hypothetical protein ACM3XM_15525 [Mycobacterium leprae]